MEKNIDFNHETDDNLIMASKNAEGEQTGLKYPYYPLASALKIAEAVKEHGGARTSVKKSILAKHLGVVENSAAFAQQLASARVFGVIEGRGDSTLTELAKKYFFPTTESDKSVALLDIFASPSAFSELLKRFDGDRLPSKDILGNILHRELGIPESWKDRAASLFSNSAQSVGAIDAQGFIRFQANRHTTSDDTSPSPPPAEQETVSALRPRPSQKEESVASPPGVVTWKSKSILVQTPEEMSLDLWKQLEAYIHLLKPLN